MSIMPFLAIVASLFSSASSGPPEDGPRRSRTGRPVISMSEAGIRIDPPPWLEDSSRFGVAVALEEDRLFVGCDGVRDGPPLPGCVLIFQSTTGGGWRWTETVTSPLSSPGDEFGSTLCLEGNRLLIGAPGTEGQRGAAWCLDLTGPGRSPDALHRIPIPDANPGDRFGESVIVHEDLVAVGAPRADLPGMFDRGRVVTARFIDGGFIFIGEPAPPLGRTGLRFGWSLALDSMLHIGSPGADAPDRLGRGTIDRAGAVLCFEREPPHRSISVVHRDTPARLERFGTSLAGDGWSTVLIGTPRAFLGKNRSGVVSLLDSHPMVEIGDESGNETELGLPLVLRSSVFAAGMPGRRGQDGRPEPGVRIGRIRTDALIPRFDLVFEDRSRTTISLAFDLEGRMIAVGSPDPAFDDGPVVAGVVHLIRPDPLLRWQD